MNDDRRIADLTRRIDTLEAQLNRYNFSSVQVFLKSIEVNGVIGLSEYASDPAPAKEGQIAYVNGKWKGCTVGGASPTWVVIGTQS